MLSTYSLEMCNQLHTWLEEQKDGYEIQALLDLVEKRWVTILEFQEYPEHLQIKHVSTSLLTTGPVDLLCDVSALRAVRRRKDTSARVAEALQDAPEL